MAYKQLTRFVCAGGGTLDEPTTAALLTLRGRVNFGSPRCINTNTLNTLHIYVDASCEGDKVGLGGVLINEQGTRLGYFSEFASESVISKVNPASGNPIFEFECLAIYAAFHLWQNLACGTNTVVFTDNEGALACMINGTSGNAYGAMIVHDLCDASFLNLWFERVNTSSNIADDPSRGVCNADLGKRFEVSLDVVVDLALRRGDE
ncbi:ubiad1 [Symbiodinium sp. CCMP2456]|nr:ubiad1 [Symbiodinium sp. CCMP2456]